MARLEFKDLSFQENKDFVRINFLGNYSLEISAKELESIGKFVVKKNSIDFLGIDQNRAEKRFDSLLARTFNRLRNSMNNKITVYVHKNSGIPLIGNIAFGLIDRNTSVIEIKPITGCNLDCVFCSVDQSKRTVDFVVEKDYLVQEFKKLAEHKECEVEAHIGAQGEPLLYRDIVELVHDLSQIKKVKTISIDTNGTMLTKNRVDKLVNAGLTRFNLSINAIDEDLAKKMAGAAYSIDKIKEIARYIVKKTGLIITPVLVPGVNDKEIEKIIRFSIKIGNKQLGIQNFLNYRFGKNPVKQMPWDLFYEKLQELEKMYKIGLIIKAEDFKICKTKKLAKPFKENDVIKARIACPGQFKDEKIAVAENRTISISKCYAEGSVKVKIIREKHNIFVGRLV